MNKKNLPLIIAVALPIMFVLSLFVISKMPVEKPDLQYDFVYSFDNSCSVDFRYNNINGRLVKTPNAVKIGGEKILSLNASAPTVYYYSISKETSTALTEKEVGELNGLESGQVSKDGYTVKYNDDYYSNPFFYQPRNDYFQLVKEGKKFKTTIEPSYACLGPEVEILGWVKNN